MLMNDDCNIDCEEKLTYKGDTVFEIGHGAKS